MESKSRGVWVFVVLVVCVGLVGCCALAFLGAIGVPVVARSGLHWWWEDRPVVRLDGLTGEETERIEESFEVGGAPELVVDNFAGSIQVRGGEEGSVRVTATKHIRGTRGPDAIEVQMSSEGSRVTVKTRPEVSSASNMWVELVIAVPAKTDLDLRTAAGAVEVEGVQGDLEIDAGAGGIEVSGVAGPARLVAGAGGIDYEGRPSGKCTFRVGAGGITLRLPADADVGVDLTAGLGGVSTQLPVRGRVSQHSIHGTIGTGEEGSISATAGVGGIDLVRR